MCCERWHLAPLWQQSKIGYKLQSKREGGEDRRKLEWFEVRLFVSGKVGADEEVSAVMAALTAAGHEITLDWTTVPHLRPYDENAVASREAAAVDIDAIRDAEALVLIPHAKGIGMYVELGAALAYGKPVYVIATSPSESMFFHHPLVTRVDHVTSLKDALKPPLTRETS